MLTVMKNVHVAEFPALSNTEQVTGVDPRPNVAPLLNVHDVF